MIRGAQARRGCGRPLASASLVLFSLGQCIAEAGVHPVEFVFHASDALADAI